jgi:hypothetical protein
VHIPRQARSSPREELGRLVVPSCPTALELTAADAAAAKTYVPGWLPAHDAGAPGDSRSHGSRLDGLDARALKPGPGPVRGLAPLSL